MSKTLTLAVIGSALVLSLLVAFVPGSERGSLGRWNSDHYSHYSATILFWHRGLAIYDTPIHELCDATTPSSRAFAQERDLSEEDVCELGERAGKRPLIINWPEYPRPYPPGQLLFTAPEALLYAHTDVSRYAINRLAVIKDLLAGHLVVWLLLSMLFLGPDDEERRRWRSFGLLVAPLVYFAIVPGSVVGFYDPISIACVCLAIARLRDAKPVAGLMWLSLSVFLHLRAIWYAPLGLVCLLRLRSPEHRDELSTTKGKLQLFVVLATLALTAMMLTRVAPYLAKFPATNNSLLLRNPLSPSSLNLIFLVGIVGVTLALERQWLLVLVIAWQGAVIGTTYQVQTWHGMFFVPLLALARWKRTSPPSLGAVLVFFVGVTRLVFGTTPLPGMFFGNLIDGNF
jgi:hypothetical protein